MSKNNNNSIKELELKLIAEKEAEFKQKQNKFNEEYELLCKKHGVYLTPVFTIKANQIIPSLEIVLSNNQ